MSPTLLGFCAGTLTTLSFVPQVVKTWRRRSADDLSLAMLLAFAAGVFCWIIYGVLTNALPIILTNALTLALAFALIGMKAGFR